MKFSYNWLRELVPGLASAPGELAQLITMKTAECEGIEAAGVLLDQVCAARVESVEPLPNSHNVKATVDAGPHGHITVVCGAPNCRAGSVAAYAPVGRKVVQGIESDGMLASGAELGINRDHAGILELVEPVGSPITGCAPDSIIEIDNKSITHRPDLWGHLGMAREVAAIVRQALSPPEVRALSASHGSSPIRIVIEDEQLCPRYSALVFENVTVKPSPLWLQYRLTAIGLNPINNIVDMTNYLMAELAQPMHAFDADLLRGGAIFVRPARRGEQFRALNEEEYTLEPSNLVIADAAGAIGLAGVIGGMDSKISEKTTRVVLESANFLASSVRKTSAALKLRTDASMRFEKSQDPANTVRALARAVDLLEELSPGIRVVGMADQQREIPPRPPIELPLAWLERKLGRAVPPAEVRDILQRLEFGVEEQSGGVFSVTVPSWRATKDVTIKDDLAEEVGRMIGYGAIPPRAPLFPATVPPANPERRFQHEARELFTGLGFTEVYNYSFVSEESVRAFGLDPVSYVRVANPIASDQALLRTSLVPGIRRNIVDNQKHRDAFRLFEIGLEIHKREAGLPDEIPHLAAAIYDRYGDGIAGLFEIKRAAECFMPGAKVCPAEAGPEQARPYEHPARAADIIWMGERTGRLFELHPTLLEVGRAAILDLDLRVIERITSRRLKYGTQYAPIRRYPSSAFDLSVIAGERELAGTLETRIAGFAGELVESIAFLRQYSGPPLAPGQKSVSFRVTAGSPERTLSSEEVSEIRQRIIEGMRGLGYDLRL